MIPVVRVKFVEGRIFWLAFWFVSALVVISDIMAPLLLPSDTVHFHTESLSDDPPVRGLCALPYHLGSFSCHQYYDRSFSLNGNQLPVCVRCFAIHLGYLFALSAAVAFKPRGGFFPSLGVFLPCRFRSPVAIFAFGVVLIVPMAIDGSLQLVTTYSSAVPQRLITGFLYGIAFAGMQIGLHSHTMQKI